MFNSEMHLVTFIFLSLELMMLACQLFYYYSRPQDKRRLWYLVLLLLLIFYNLTSGLFPDENLEIPVTTQNVLAYGGGFLMAAYFPWYFYKTYSLISLRFHALYGVGLFLLLPYLVFFVIIYPKLDDLEYAIRWGLIVPFVYSLVLLWVILAAIRKRVSFRQGSLHPLGKLEMLSVYAAVIPWVLLSVFSYLHVSQWIEATVTNLGFVWVTVLFMVRSAAMNRQEYRKLLELDYKRNAQFVARCMEFGLTAREMEMIALIGKGMTYKEMASVLGISWKTVNSHVQHVFQKTHVKNRITMLQTLGFGILESTEDGQGLEMGDAG